MRNTVEMENVLAEIVIDAEQKPTLLVVDDSRVMRVSLKKILKSDFEIIEAVDGEDAWEKLQAAPEVQGIFSDLSMPHLDGYGLLERVRTSDEARIRDLPFIVITGKEGDLSDLLAEVQSKGANDLVGKPFKTDDIISRTKQFLQEISAAAMDGDVVHLNPEAETQKKAEAMRLVAEAEAERKAEEARLAVEAQRLAEEEARRQSEEAARLAAEAQRQFEEQARLAAEAEAEAERKAEEEARLAAEAQHLAEEEARRQAEEAARITREAEPEAPANLDTSADNELSLAQVESEAEEESSGWPSSQLTDEEQASVDAIREKIRLESEKQERAHQESLLFSGGQAVFVRMILPLMSLADRLFKLDIEGTIQSLKDRLPK